MVVEEAPRPAADDQRSAAAAANGPRRQVLALSARTEKALLDLARRYVEFLGQDPPAWDDVCYTAAVRREHHDCRLAVLADRPRAAREELQRFVEAGGSRGGDSGSAGGASPMAGT